MRRLFSCVALVILVAAAAHPGWADEPVRLSLADAMRWAATNNTQVLVAETRTRFSEGAKTRERADLLPELAADVSLSRQQRSTETFGFPKDGTITIDDTIPFDIRYPGLSPSVIRDLNLPTTGELDVNQTVEVTNDIGESTDPYTLFDARLRLDVPIIDVKESREFEASKSAIGQSRGEYSAAAESAMTQAAVLYLRALAAKEEVAALEIRIAMNEQRVRFRADQRTTGLATDLDVKSDELIVATNRRELREAQKKLADALRGLKRLLNMSPSTALELTDPIRRISVPSTPIEDAVEMALERRPDYVAIKQAEAAALQRRDAAKADRYPTLRALGNYGRQGGAVDDTVDAWFIGAFMEIPIFDSFRRSGVIEQREALLAEARLMLEDVASAIRADLESSREALEVAKESIAVADESLAYAESVVALRKDQATAGRATPLEVNSAEVALAESKFRRLEKVYDYNIAALQWYRSLGHIEGFLELAP